MKAKDRPGSEILKSGLNFKKKRSDLERERSWKTKSAADRKATQLKAALIALDIDRHALERAPQFSQILIQASGGLPTVLQAMRLSADSAILTFLGRYDRLSEIHRKILSWEAIAILAGVDIPRLLGSIILAMRQQSANAVKVIALSSHAAVTRSTVKNAMKPGGVRDRQMMHSALGFLAAPKGQTINVNMPGSGTTTEDEGPREIDPDDIDVNDWMPDLTETQKLIGE